MFHLLKKLFSLRGGTPRVAIYRDEQTKPNSTHRVPPFELWLLLVGATLGLIALIIVLIRFTPLGGLIYKQREVRNRAISIQQKVAAMGDTIRARDKQLRQLKKVIASGKDTNLMAASSGHAPNAGGQSVSSRAVDSSTSATHPMPLLPANSPLVTNLFSQTPAFPAPYPLAGAKTRRFHIKTGHYGLDIATSAGSTFKAIAAGVIISEEWTFNYGYMIIVQHTGGLISIYKHAQTLAKSTGETVQQGDILGSIGKVGILSSGPHLHIEIWKKGIPQNPENYLQKL